MDPIKPVDLNPKLKEAYERVMGTAQTPQTTQATTPPYASPITTPAPTVSPEVKPAEINAAKPVTAFVAKPSQKGLNFSFPLPLLILFVILFLLGYTLFWLKFFKISLPFLPL